MPRTLTVIIPWHNRPEIADSLAANAPLFRKHEVTVVIVNCGGNADELEQIVRQVGTDALLIHVQDVAFNISLARNIGLRYSRSDYVSMLDTDVIISDITLRQCLNCLDKDNVLSIARMKETESRPALMIHPQGRLENVLLTHEMKLTWDDGRDTVVQLFRSYMIDGSRGGQGQIFVERENLLKVEGYNSELQGWGFEDVDVLIRLQYALGLTHHQLGEVTHLSHSDAKRDLRGTTRYLSNTANISLAMANYAKGNFIGSFTADIVKNRDRIQLREMRYSPWQLRCG